MKLDAAIAGVGESAVGVVPGRPALQLQSDATHAALSDAGLTLADIDGLITVPVSVEAWSVPCAVVANHLGISPSYLSTLNLAGASGAAMIHHAALAIAAGEADTVLCVAGQNPLSSARARDPIKAMAESGAAHPQHEMPYGPLIPSLYALIAQRHMHEFGTTSAQLAEIAAAIRGHGALNPRAHKRERVEVADVLASRMVTSPLHVLDCSVVSDGACAAIVTSAERARDLRQKPVRLLGQGYGLSHSYIGEYRDMVTTGAVRSGERAFQSAGLKRSDVDVAEIYDCFTITVLVELEDLGFCAKGEGGSFVEGGRIRLGGELPITTHGGLLSYAHPGYAGGFFHVIEAVRQMRGEAGERQVKDAKVALVHGNGGVASIHCTLLLGGP